MFSPDFLQANLELFLSIITRISPLIVRQARRWQQRRLVGDNVCNHPHQRGFKNTSGEVLVDVLIEEISPDGMWNVLGYANVLPNGESIKVWAGGSSNKNKVLVVSYRGIVGREVMLLSDGWGGGN